MKTYKVVLTSVYREVHIVEAESRLDVEDVLLSNYCPLVESECTESDIVEVIEINGDQ